MRVSFDTELFMTTQSDCFEQALARYQRNEFTDADVTTCTGLSARSKSVNSLR